MNCPSCGAPVSAGAGFCGNCGAKLAMFAPAPAPVPVPVPVQAPMLAPPPPSPPPPPAEMPQVPSALPTAVIPPMPPAAMPVAQPVVQTVPPLATPVFVTPPPVPVVPFVPTEDDLDATVVSPRKRRRSPWLLVLPDGQSYAIESTVLIGRDVKPRAKWPSAKLLSVDDPTKSVSKTHAVLEADAEKLWITDLKSTNGVVVTAPDGQESDGDDGGRVHVQPGSTITLGKYVMQVEKD